MGVFIDLFLPCCFRASLSKKIGARLLPSIACLKRISPTLFHAASTLSGSLCSPPSPRGEGFVRRYSFSTYACICSDDMGIALLSQTTHLRRSPLDLFHPTSPIQSPPLRGTSFHRKEGVSTRAPSLGRGCRAQRGGVGFLLGRRSPLLFAFPIGERGPRQPWIGCSRKRRT